jgi:hypothetical protein
MRESANLSGKFDAGLGVVKRVPGRALKVVKEEQFGS